MFLLWWGSDYRLSATGIGKERRLGLAKQEQISLNIVNKIEDYLGDWEDLEEKGG